MVPFSFPNFPFFFPFLYATFPVAEVFELIEVPDHNRSSPLAKSSPLPSCGQLVFMLKFHCQTFHPTLGNGSHLALQNTSLIRFPAIGPQGLPP